MRNEICQKSESTIAIAVSAVFIVCTACAVLGVLGCVYGESDKHNWHNRYKCSTGSISSIFVCLLCCSFRSFLQRKHKHKLKFWIYKIWYPLIYCAALCRFRPFHHSTQLFWLFRHFIGFNLTHFWRVYDSLRSIIFLNIY